MVKTANAENWKSRDFVKFFYVRYGDFYDSEPDINWDRDCSIMLRVINDFRKVDRSEVVVLAFIKWAFDNYKKISESSEPIKIGFLHYLMDRFLGFPIKQRVEVKKKIKRKQVVYSPDVMQFLKKQRKLYRDKLKKGKK